MDRPAAGAGGELDIPSLFAILTPHLAAGAGLLRAQMWERVGVGDGTTVTMMGMGMSLSSRVGTTRTRLLRSLASLAALTAGGPSGNERTSILVNDVERLLLTVCG